MTISYTQVDGFVRLCADQRIATQADSFLATTRETHRRECSLQALSVQQALTLQMGDIDDTHRIMPVLLLTFSD
jgi:hypothetical protein